MSLPLGESLRKLAESHDEPHFRSMMGKVSLAGVGIAVSTEALAYISPEFPKDTIGFVVMTATFVASVLVARSGLSRRWLGLAAIVTFGVIGWYIARAIFLSGGIASPQRDALYLGLAGAQALLTFSVIEFVGVTIVMSAAFLVTGSSMTQASLAEFDVTFVYIAAFLVVSAIGIAGRTRLQRSEAAARRELEQLNQNLEAEVERQVERIQRAQLLGRFLPREISERVLDGDADVGLEHARREVTVLCAVPVGFLESLNTLEAEQVVPLVNSFVSAMSRLAHEHHGVIERFVGPRITVLFGAVGDVKPRESARRAARMASEMQRESNKLLQRWEADGVATLRLRMAIGIAAGTAVVGTFGSERRVEYSALGDAMVRAHRLAGAAIPGEVRFDEVAARRLEGVVELQPAPPIELAPGVASPTFVAPAAVAEPAEARENGEAAIAETATFSPEHALVSTVHGSGESGGGRAALPRLPLGSLFDGRYRIDEAIGHGGMAAVYRAKHVSLNQERALKLIAPALLSSAHAEEQLRHEVEATARINHPNVVQLHDFGRSLEGHYYLALDFIHGRTLAQRLATDGAIGEQEAVAMAIDILAALQAAHELRLVHRDVKPGNVLIDESGRVRVTDFGLAQPLGAAIDPVRPLIVGTPAYMSPEQCQGRALDGRSDLYSFGVLFYEMLCGSLPYASTAADAIFRQIIDEDPIPLAVRAPALSPELWAPIARCLHKDPALRPRSAQEVQQELESWYGLRVTA